ncbi:helix-turn-helix domain-containing protein [Pseudomonas sp. GD03842]|uniref:helix-turn-helix domain-containing protein n=1 Tax=unclassified Pseudomonas TaxID=196821 RepID=UPI000D3D200A|nr:MULTISPECIES: helix-turn-helix transcriptional regulator [unclassified Pseudomonas]MDH0747223.1 helix-turn-helix domain-containing protein [Pseudomonas sp. GD03842]RAU42257.1 XRE family transcriptional regulator [Pseudomonas sp. RIT 409]RAU55094.1 XRE family transcriptional regulator [Pseudomonas sp. RIT 412]
MTGIGSRLREERTRLKLSQSALGAIGGVETNAQGNYENGVRSPKADYLLRILGAGVDINYVLTGVRPRDSDSTLSPSRPPDPLHNEHFENVTHQLHRNLHGLIDALYQMALLIEARANDTQDETARSELETVRAQAQELAQSSVRLIFDTSKLT